MSALKRVQTRRNVDGEMGWAVVGDAGAIEFHIYTSPIMGGRGIGGVETHQRTPFDYSTDKDSPDHANCYVLNGPCWHDGTSLWASEHWIPSYHRFGEAWVWEELEKTYRETWPADEAEAGS